MICARTAIMMALVAFAAPATAETVHVVPPAGITTAQLAPQEPDTRRPTVCTEQYAPVCGRLNDVIKTYPNQCYARAAGAEVIAQGPCTGRMPRDRR